MNHFDIEQGSILWHLIRAYMPTASTSTTLNVNGKRPDKLGAGAITNANKKLAFIETGVLDDVKAYSLQWGHQWEPFARREYQRIKFRNLSETGIIIQKGVGGYSPDGLVEGTNGAVEIKCPSSDRVFYELREKISDHDKAYIDQTKFGCMVAGLDWVDLFYYSPRFADGENSIIHRVHRDHEWEKEITPKVKSFCNYLADKLGADNWDRLNVVLANNNLKPIE